ncbi:MAG: NAD(P)H-dependent oxidoreductase [Actinobacteria bacterium]|nr:NAD(P)H-dependent oxidoreductase [Actinomycetota bacterium]
MILLGLCGSLRRGSYNRRLLEAAARELPRRVRFEVFDGLADIPPYNEDHAAPDVVRRMRDTIAGADAVLIATPEYNASLPGQLKNALDWASRPFPHNALRDKPAGVIGASTGLFGAVWAQAELRKVLKTIGARMLDDELPVGQVDTAFGADGALRDPALASALADLVGQLVVTAHGAGVNGRAPCPARRG